MPPSTLDSETLGKKIISICAEVEKRETARAEIIVSCTTTSKKLLLIIRHPTKEELKEYFEDVSN